jgi:hypothetical protein
MKASSLRSRRPDKAKTELVKAEKTEHCRTICICSVTSSLHVLVPLLKCLAKLGSVQVVSEDKSILLLSENMTPIFERGDIFFRYEEEISLIEEFHLDDYHYNVIITHEFLPIVEVDKYIMLNNRHYFREQFDSIEQKYIPIMSVFNPGGLSKEEIKKEKDSVYVNEVLVPAPSYASVESSINVLLMQVGKQELRFDSRIMNFVVESLSGIDGCTKSHIKQCLMEKGETFASLS